MERYKPLTTHIWLAACAEEPTQNANVYVALSQRTSGAASRTPLTIKHTAHPVQPIQSLKRNETSLPRRLFISTLKPPSNLVVTCHIALNQHGGTATIQRTLRICPKIVVTYVLSSVTITSAPLSLSHQERSYARLPVQPTRQEHARARLTGTRKLRTQRGERRTKKTSPSSNITVAFVMSQGTTQQHPGPGHNMRKKITRPSITVQTSLITL